MIAEIPKIEPLVNDLKRLDIGTFFKSNEYKRYLIRANIDELWRNAFSHVQRNRGYFFPDFDHDYFDSIEAMGLQFIRQTLTNK